MGHNDIILFRCKTILCILLFLMLGGCVSIQLDENVSVSPEEEMQITDENRDSIEDSVEDTIEDTISNNTDKNYEGEWHRTGVGSYQWAEFIISDWKEGESFEVSGDANYGYYGGPIEGTAIFIEDDLAVLYDENVEDFLQEEGDHGIYFQFLEDSIIVTHDPYVRLWFGGGGIATAEGTYIQGEPEYTNCDDVSEIFSDGELKQIQELLGEGYNNLFKNIIETGEMTEYKIDNGRLWEAYRPYYSAEWCNIIIYDDGRIYIEGQAYTGPTQFYTNSEDTEMPNIEMLKSEQPVMFDTGERNHNYWYTEPDPQDTFMLRVEGNISANQAWVDFLKGEMPDYTGMDFSDRIFAGLNRPYTLQDMEGYSLDLWAYGQKEYVEDGGILTNIQIFPYDVDADEEEELLFVCKSYAGMVKLWVLDEAYEDTWLLYPSISNWIPPGNSGRAWLWSNGFICYQARDSLEGCPNYINIYSQGKGGYFKLECNEYRSSDTLAQYYLDYEEGGRWKTVDVVFDRNGTMIDGSLIYAENVCTGPRYDGDLAIITQIYEETVGDAVPVRELTGLDGTEDGVIIVTREEFYSGAYLK